ncbi:MAG: tetratricopeptide repeat protein [Verrucomicrobia bacterium]|nr:tetratricopeptide repeat protein [Verrucomicrobiota bacterium]
MSWSSLCCLIFTGIFFLPCFSLAQRIEEESVGFYQRRGSQYFELGKFKEAIADWDRTIELDPRLEPRHWQRGIAYYYAKEYQKGVDQFELHQTVNSQDVENAVWHFICNVRLNGIETARKQLIPIQYDSRVPMDKVWDLFAGKGTVEAVLEAANRPSPYKRQQLCYAHLYLGLYFEALEKKDLAQRHIALAANDYSMNNYMGMVAQVHAKTLKD